MTTNTPTNTYNSLTDLSLGNIPQVEDPEVYRALLDLHNAIEILLTSSDDGDAIFAAYIQKRRKTAAHTADYTVQITDGTIYINASLNPVTITLHPVAEGVGYKYNIKCIDATFTAKLIGSGSELIDLADDGWELDLMDEIPVRNDGTNWWIE